MDAKMQVVSLPEYKGNLSKLFDFEHPMTQKEAFAMHRKHEQVVKKLAENF